MTETTRPPSVYDEDYHGARWTYACTHRPPGYAAVPDGRIVGGDRPHPTYQFGTIQYPRQLTAEEINRYELDDLGQIARDRVTAQELWTELLRADRATAMILLRYQWAILHRPSFLSAWEQGDLTRFLDEDCGRVDLAVADLRAYLVAAAKERARVAAATPTIPS